MYKLPLEVSMSIMVPKWCNWSLLKVLSHFSFSIYLHPSSKGVIPIPFFSECAQISLSSPELIYYIYIFIFTYISKYNLNLSTYKLHQYIQPKNNKSKPWVYVSSFFHSVLMTWPFFSLPRLRPEHHLWFLTCC